VTATVVALIWRWNDDQVGQRPVIGRMTAHIGVALTLVLLIFVGSFQVDSLAAVVTVADRTMLEGFAQDVDAASASMTLAESPYYRPGSQARIARQAEVHTAIPERPRLEVVTYTVRPGDTAEKIAAGFGLQPTTLLWSNPEMEKMPDLLRVGQVLTILPIDGVYHTVTPTDTLASVAQTYKVAVAVIRDCPYNEFTALGGVTAGQKLIVPGGTKPYEPRSVTTYTGEVPSALPASGEFRWPASGALTQGYWYGHRAIDIGAALGAAIRASDSGYISFAGWTDIGYGYLVVVNHQNGYQTYYAHLSNIFVREGEPVEASQVVGAMGSTGNSTGPHLHFEIRYDGYPTNPLIFLP
jgi:murein DD-endopeptidase MepM/ murein hydrolase activator NlpD